MYIWLVLVTQWGSGLHNQSPTDRRRRFVLKLSWIVKRCISVVVYGLMNNKWCCALLQPQTRDKILQTKVLTEQQDWCMLPYGIAGRPDQSSPNYGKASLSVCQISLMTWPTIKQRLRIYRAATTRHGGLSCHYSQTAHQDKCRLVYTCSAIYHDAVSWLIHFQIGHFSSITSISCWWIESSELSWSVWNWLMANLIWLLYIICGNSGILLACNTTSSLGEIQHWYKWKLGKVCRETDGSCAIYAARKH